MSHFVVPDRTVPLLMQYMAKIVPVSRLNVVQENILYRTSNFDRIPFYKPISLLYPTESLHGTPTCEPSPII